MTVQSRSIDLASITRIAVPAVAGFALGRMTAPRSAQVHPYSMYQPTWAPPAPASRGMGSALLNVGMTVGGWELGKRAGSHLARGEFGRGLDAGTLGTWYSALGFSRHTGGHLSPLLRPAAGIAGALLGSWLSR